MTLTEFLLARLAEDEAAARAPTETDWTADNAFEQDDLRGRQPHGASCGWRLGEGMSRECECGYPARVLADVEAKRRIVENCEAARAAADAEPFSERIKSSDGPVAAYWRGQNWTCRVLAAVYSDHADYRADEWAP